jgi:hypothetical protein
MNKEGKTIDLTEDFYRFLETIENVHNLHFPGSAAFAFMSLGLIIYEAIGKETFDIVLTQLHGSIRELEKKKYEC